MRAFKCDRCKKFQEVTRDEEQSAIVRYYPKPLYDGDKVTGREIELCDDCNQKLQHFLCNAELAWVD